MGTLEPAFTLTIFEIVMEAWERMVQIQWAFVATLRTTVCRAFYVATGASIAPDFLSSGKYGNG